VRGDPDHPANFGRLCTKGTSLHLSMAPSARLLHPELRTDRSAPRRRVGWDEALDCAARRFAECITEHGPDSVAFYISGQLLTEDYYVFNKLAKGLIGTNNVDTNSRLCMSSAVAGYKLSLGADAPPCCYEDVDHAGLILIAGSNTAFAHPIVFRRIEDARAANPDLKLIVVDPRRTVTARAADLHLAIRPGTDVMLFNAMLHVMQSEGLLDRRYIEAHTEGYASLAPLLAACSPAGRGRRLRYFRRFHRHRRALVCPIAGRSLALLPGAQSVGERYLQEFRPDQPASGDGADRPTGSRPVLADRPAQRDGRT
jgi:assimilatory nitrate reductase catalytic subunit